MALDAERSFSRGRIALGGATASGFDKFEQTASPKYHVGFKVEEADGSVYRYVHFGATVNRGVLVAGDLSESAITDDDNNITAPSSSVDTTDGTVGSRFVQLTAASITAGQFAGGKFVTTDDTGEGYTYDIKDNTATDDPASGDIRIELYQPLEVAVDGTTDFAIAANKYHNLEIATTTDAVVAGVSCATISSAGNYGWIQTKGQCGVLQDATVPGVGAACQLSGATSGAVSAAATGDTVGTLLLRPFVGKCVHAGDSGGHSVIDLDLD